MNVTHISIRSSESGRFDFELMVTDEEAEAAFQLLKNWWNSEVAGMTKSDADRVNVAR